MTKMGFYFNQDDCVGCKACQVVCKDKNELPIGVILRRVREFEVGEYPQATGYRLSQSCNHCENPACVQVCPVGAMQIDEADGTVRQDHALCIGCQSCVNACPYGHPQYNPEENKSIKCDACKQLRDAGEPPACVAACPLRAIEFGPIDELMAAHPDAVKDIAVLPDSSQTSPCTIIGAKPAATDAGFVEVVL